MRKFTKCVALVAAAGTTTAALAQDNTGTLDLSQLLAGGIPGIVVTVIAVWLLGRFFLGGLFNFGGD